MSDIMSYTVEDWLERLNVMLSYDTPTSNKIKLEDLNCLVTLKFANGKTQVVPCSNLVYLRSYRLMVELKNGYKEYNRTFSNVTLDMRYVNKRVWKLLTQVATMKGENCLNPAVRDVLEWTVAPILLSLECADPKQIVPSQVAAPASMYHWLLLVKCMNCGSLAEILTISEMLSFLSRMTAEQIAQQKKVLGSDQMLVSLLKYMLYTFRDGEEVSNAKDLTKFLKSSQEHINIIQTALTVYGNNYRGQGVRSLLRKLRPCMALTGSVHYQYPPLLMIKSCLLMLIKLERSTFTRYGLDMAEIYACVKNNLYCDDSRLFFLSFDEAKAVINNI